MTCLLILVNSVGASLAASQVDEGHHAVSLGIVDILELHLQDGMRTRAVGVGTSHSTGSLLETRPNHLHDVLDTLDGLLCQSDYIHFLLGIFTTHQFLPLAQ